MKPQYKFGLALAALLACTVVHAAIYQGSLVTTDQWHFFSKFCCSNEVPDDPNCYMNFNVSTTNTNLHFLVYIGYNGVNGTPGAQPRDGDWDYCYDHRPGTSDALSCSALSALHKDGGDRPVVVGNSTDVIRMQQFARAYFWFITAADCNSTTGINIPFYFVNWTNPGGWWLQNFSFDQQGLVFIYIAYTIFYLLLGAIHGYAVWQQTQNDQWHPVIRVLTVAIGLALLGVIAEMIHYLIFAGNGIGSPVILGFGDLMNMAAQVVLMFQCILIAKGWAITTSYLTDKYIVLVVMGLFILAYLALFIWDKAVPNPASVLYFYESVPGIIVSVLRVLTCGWFVWSLRNTIRLESLPEKRVFYFIFGGAYSIWFLLLPLIVLIAVFLAPWVRFRIITGMMVTSDFLGLSALAFLLWPSRASNYFVIKASPQLLSVKATGYGTSSAYDATNAL